jgi:hypothetical protein
VGSTIPSVADTGWSRREADLAIRVLASRPDRTVAPIEAVRADTIVLALRDHGLRDPYLHAGRVELLRRHDELHGTSYVDTLAAYFNAFGYIPLAAKSVFVHPNTFRYRLRRLSELSGLNLDDPVERLVAELQLRIGSEDAATSGAGDFGAPGRVSAPKEARGSRRRSRRHQALPTDRSGTVHREAPRAEP